MSTDFARALLDWWQTPHPDLPHGADGSGRSPLELLSSATEEEFAAAIDEADAIRSFVVPHDLDRGNACE